MLEVHKEYLQQFFRLNSRISIDFFYESMDVFLYRLKFEILKNIIYNITNEISMLLGFRSIF